jgi:hypothetical protein
MYSKHTIYTDITSVDTIKEEYPEHTIVGLNFNRPLGPQLMPHGVPIMLDLALPDSFTEKEYNTRHAMLSEAHHAHLFCMDSIYRSSLEWYRNSLSNLRYIEKIKPISAECKPAVKEAAVIIGNGPSAASLCIEGLPKDATVIACWHVYPRIKDIVDVDIVVHIDRANLHETTYYDFKGDIVLTPFAGSQFFLSYPCATPYLYLGSEHAYNHVVADLFNMPIHPPVHTNVGHAMANVAALCGAKTIYAAGIDLAHEKPGENRYPVDNKHGNKVYTEKHMEVHRNGFIDFAHYHPDINCVNLSKIGLDLYGWKDRV